jgi:hypothetical protein
MPSWFQNGASQFTHLPIILLPTALLATGCLEQSRESVPTQQATHQATALEFLGTITTGILGTSTTAERIARTPVYGVVTVGGATVLGGQVTFVSTEEPFEHASGILNEQGEYAVYSGANGLPGIRPGTYEVTLSADHTNDGLTACHPPAPADEMETAQNSSPHSTNPTPRISSTRVQVLPEPRRIDIAFP